MERDVPIRVGGHVDYTTDEQAQSGAYIGGMGKVMAINGDEVVVNCIFSGRVMTVKKSLCVGFIGGY